jgi:hypothetical protein
LREYPGKPSLVEMLLHLKTQRSKEAAIREEVGEEGYKTYTAIKTLKDFLGKAQARLPYEVIIE